MSSFGIYSLMAVEDGPMLFVFHLVSLSLPLTIVTFLRIVLHTLTASHPQYTY